MSTRVGRFGTIVALMGYKGDIWEKIMAAPPAKNCRFFALIGETTKFKQTYITL